MFEKFKKTAGSEQIDQEPLRQVSENDPRIKLYTPIELSQHSEYVTVRRTDGAIEAGWRVVGESDDETLVEVHKILKDVNDKPITHIKVVARESLAAAYQEGEELKELAAIERQRQDDEHQAERERLRRERESMGAKAASLVEYDGDGLVIIPDWVRQSKGTPQDKVSPVPETRDLQDSAKQRPDEKDDRGVSQEVHINERPGDNEARLAEVARVEAALDNLVQSMQESDRVPAWHYAVARHAYEVNDALRRLSSRGKTQALEYRKLIEQLQQLRKP